MKVLIPCWKGHQPWSLTHGHCPACAIGSAIETLNRELPKTIDAFEAAGRAVAEFASLLRCDRSDDRRVLRY